MKFLCLKSNRNKMSFWDKCCCVLSEFFGTAMLLFLGCMGCIESDAMASNHFIRSINFGLVVMITIQCFGCCSGAHLNPSVSIAAFIHEILSWPMLLAFIIAQVLGAFCGYGLLKIFIPENLMISPGNLHGFCMTTVDSNIATWQAVGVEFFITFALVLVNCGAWDPRNKHFQDSIGIKIGLAVACLSITAGTITGASMNPARSLGSAIWNNDFDQHWIYWVGPIAASIFGASFYKIVFRRELDNNTSEIEKQSEKYINKDDFQVS